MKAHSLYLHLTKHVISFTLVGISSDPATVLNLLMQNDLNHRKRNNDYDYALLRIERSLITVTVSKSPLSFVPQVMTPIHRPTTTVVVPAMNEARNLPHVLPLIPAWVDEVILVDGNSKDNTVDVARALLPHIRIVKQSGRGKGNALREGFAAATGDIIVMIDADGSTDPGEIGNFVRHLRSGADFVKGSRFLQGAGSSDISRIRNGGNACITMAVRILFGGRYSDLCYGYNAFWRSVLPKLDLDCNGFEIETLMGIRALKARLKIVEIHSFEHERIHGTSNLHAVRDGWRIFRLILRERFMKRIAPIQDADASSAPTS
ncbi:glycosyltransferase family 2 protein [Deinococcus frigens]|uniref:glycosyltransferase family 2 protein n=1 Tax=Deinococcus frigens TaxID=249403 RepID=UPI001FDF21A5|nr:glycosyltransferase family 2 protein [Deinococcus frigens]